MLGYRCLDAGVWIEALRHRCRDTGVEVQVLRYGCRDTGVEMQVKSPTKLTYTITDYSFDVFLTFS